LPQLADCQKTTILSSVPLMRFVGDWTFMERYGRRRLDPHWFGFGPSGEANRHQFRHWLQTSPADAVVFVERLPEAKQFDFSLPDYLVHEQLLEELHEQTVMRPVEKYEFPRWGCRVSIWRKAK
jgi:hypothetical protein